MSKMQKKENIASDSKTFVQTTVFWIATSPLRSRICNRYERPALDKNRITMLIGLEAHCLCDLGLGLFYLGHILSQVLRLRRNNENHSSL